MKLLLGVPIFCLTLLSLVPIQAKAQGETLLDPSQFTQVPSNESGYQFDSDYDQTDSIGEPKLLNMNYYGIFYGPSLGEFGSYQAGPVGPDHDRPILLKNFLNVGHSFNQDISLYGSAYWLWQPVENKGMQLMDPFLRLSYNSIFYKNGFNLYGDVRAHFPVTSFSRDCDMLFGLQTFEALTYEVPASRFTLGLYTSQRTNFFGEYGLGNDLELYFAPNINYQLSRTVTLTLMYEYQKSHFFGMAPFHFYGDETDIAPGLSWDVTPNLMVNPYFNIQTTKEVSLRSTSFGMMVNLNLL